VIHARALLIGSVGAPYRVGGPGGPRGPTDWKADAQALPFPVASFDTVVCTLGLCGFPGERAAITEMYRALRGSLLLLDHVGSHHTLIRLGQRLLES
jgi:SAM-dependent methyltransferase